MTDPRKGLPSASDTLRYLCLGQRNLKLALIAKGLISNESCPAAQSGTRDHAARAREDVEFSDMTKRLAEIEVNTVASIPGEWQLLGRERRLWLRDGLKPIFSGQADWIYCDGVSAIVGDDKTGRIEVSPAERNYQLRDLAVLFYLKYQVAPIFAIISQPWITHEPSIARYDVPDLMAAEIDLRAHLQLERNPDAPRTPGAHCKYCPCQPWCEESKSYAVTQPRSYLERIERGEVQLELGEKGARVLESIEVGYKILDKLWNEYEKAVRFNPDAIPGWYLADGSERRKITDYRRAREIMASELPKEELDAATEFAIGQLEKYYCNRSGLIQRKAKAEFNKLLEPVMEIRQSKSSLKPIPQRGKKSEQKELLP